MRYSESTSQNMETNLVLRKKIKIFLALLDWPLFHLVPSMLPTGQFGTLNIFSQQQGCAVQTFYIYKEILLSDDDVSFQMPNASPYMHDIGKDI